ncbi:GlxA family transcriptional regulator [Thalassovita sp.]|uniref:GlxA family transcriptional regulator n=1 Tax=Thalassovita sp. TaxID=1979401 RepID=UPI002B270659|nr:GlxA family transcriptional regulator [Thalassovita sp.]
MQQDQFIQKAASASFPMTFDGPPQDFYFLLLPNMTMLSVASAIEPLRIANQLTNSRLYRWFTMTEDGEPVTCSTGIKVTPDTALQPLPSNSVGFVCCSIQPLGAASEKTLNWLRREDRFGRPLGGICTGAFALAAAGLLNGRRFTLHWENHDSFQETYPQLTPSPNIYEIDGRIMSCGGGNSAIDMMLALIEERHGPDLAALVADMCLHTRSGPTNSPQKSSRSFTIGTRNRNLLAAIRVMENALEEPLLMEELCATLGVSRRQIERLFKRYLGQSPMSYYNDLRLTRAYGFLNETDMTVTEIAAATGFRSASHLARAFRKKYGNNPNSFRKYWS